MASFFVLKPPLEKAASDDWRFVADRFAWFGFAFPAVWLIWHGLWRWAIPALVIQLLPSVLAFQELQVPLWADWSSSLMLSLLVGLEGNNLRLARLQRLGYAPQAIIEAPDRNTAEEFFFLSGGNPTPASREPMPAEQRSLPVVRAAPKMVPQAGPGIGLFDQKR